ncbi:MAG: tetratricopeptide repeat protein, partial [Holophaga sp.]|nr:tetratricopeptide repeat protein [Holophaga sp.]
MRFIHSIWIAMFFLVPCPLVMARQAQEIPLGLDSLKGRARLSALLDVTVQSDGPGPTKERLAQAKEASVLARDLGDPLAQARAMSQLGYWQYRDADYPGSLETYFQTRELCTKIQDRSGASLMEEQIGHTFLYCYADYNNALKYYLEAFETAKIANDSNRIVKTMSFIGDVYSQKGEFQTATSYFTKALAICENPGAPPRGNSIAQMDENAEYSLKMAQG